MNAGPEDTEEPNDDEFDGLEDSEEYPEANEPNPYNEDLWEEQ